MLVAGLAVGLCGLVVEVAVLRPIYKSPELYQLVATFGVILVIQDLTLLGWGPEDLMGPRAPGFTGVVRILGQPVPTYDLVLIALSLLVLAARWWGRWGSTSRCCFPPCSSSAPSSPASGGRRRCPRAGPTC
jgi:branched-chain amino acid transport system permease protein